MQHDKMPGAWIPETYDARDRPYRGRPDGVIKDRVNLVEEHPQWFEDVYDQLKTNSCAANAASTAYRFLARKLNEGGAAKPPFLDDPSRLFIYYNARILEIFDNLKNEGKPVDENTPPKVTDRGSNNRFALKSLNVHGVASEQIWPFDVAATNSTPGPEIYNEAYKLHTLEYCRLDPNHPAAVEKHLSLEDKKAVGVVTLIQLKQCLSEGYPVIFGFWWYGPDSEFQEDKEKHEWILPALPVELQHKGPPKAYGGHTVLCIGYDDLRGQVLIQNSRGPDWINKPRFWMDYSWIRDWEASDDFWMVKTLEPRAPKL